MTFSFPTSASPSPSKKKNKNKKQTGPSFDGPFFVAPATPNRVGSSARLYFRSPESSLIKCCRGGSLRPPARLQQSRFRAMKEKSKIKLPARFTARWHAPRIRCGRRHADSRKGCPYDSIKPASGSGKEKYYPATCSNSVHAGACHKTGKTTVQIPGYERKSKIKLPARFTARWHAPRIRCTAARASFC